MKDQDGSDLEVNELSGSVGENERNKDRMFVKLNIIRR